MIWKYYDSGNYEQNYIQLFLITLGIIYGINLLGLLIQSPLLCYD